LVQILNIGSKENKPAYGMNSEFTTPVHKLKNKLTYSLAAFVPKRSLRICLTITLRASFVWLTMFIFAVVTICRVTEISCHPLYYSRIINPSYQVPMLDFWMC